MLDDRLLVARCGWLLHVFDQNNPSLLWPALLEKAYMKVQGGYGEKGSGPASAIWMLLGWIPEQILLK